MKTMYNSLFCLLFSICFTTGGFVSADTSIDKWSVRLAENFMALYPDTIAYPAEAKSYKWNYEQGLMLEAFYRIWKQSGDSKYFDYLKKNIDYYIEEDGTIKTYKSSDYNLDNLAPGRILLYLYQITSDEKYKIAAETLISQIYSQPRTRSGGFWHKKIYPDQMWLDGLYMAEPFYTQYSVVNNKPQNFDDVLRQFLLIEKNLKDERTGLYYHGWDESRKMKWADSVTGRSPNFWGRSVGWFMMSLVDVLEILPSGHPGRIDLLRILRNLSDSLFRFREDNSKLWYQIIDKGALRGNYLEASASAMFIYSFAKGANNGWLDKKFFGIAKESFQGLLDNLVKTEEGKYYLTNVVSVGGLGGKPFRNGSFEYYISEPKRINDFKGYGPLLLAAVELEQPEVTIGLDYYFNCEFKDGSQFHYIWEDEKDSGFSELAKIIAKLNAGTVALKEKPSDELLGPVEIYIIVDPDTPGETEHPNYIDEDSRKVIHRWVNNGGILLLLANDSINCEFNYLNLLSEYFGIHFKGDSKNRVVNRNFNQGKIDAFPDHPIFRGVNAVYLKEISTLTLNHPAEIILAHKGNVVMAGSEYGKGFVFAVGDPWLYNEYIDNRKLPAEFENYKAAENLFTWLINRTKSDE